MTPDDAHLHWVTYCAGRSRRLSADEPRKIVEEYHFFGAPGFANFLTYVVQAEADKAKVAELWKASLK